MNHNVLAKWSWVFALALAVPAALGQADDPQAKARAKLAFDVAKRYFRDGMFATAVERLDAFGQAHPGSPHRAEAALLEGQARFQLGEYETVATGLTAGLPGAGAWTDRYLYWIGEAQFALGRFGEAAARYGQVIEKHPGSARALTAALGQAQSLNKLGKLRECIAALEPADGPFQRAASARPGDPLIVDGRLLLANAYFKLGELGAARLLLENLPDTGLSPERFWRKHHMLASVYLADASLKLALSGATNLVQLAKGIADPVYAARSVDFHGDVLRSMSQPDGAVALYERNLATNVPPDWRRTALLKIVDLYVEENRLTNAVQRLERLFIRHPGDPATGLAHLTLGELLLRQFYGLPDASRLQSTNLLSQALGHFDVILQGGTEPDLMGKSWLGRGWALWEWGRLSGKGFQLSLAQQAYSNAVRRLPRSREQAVAQFKVADCLFHREKHDAAASSYWAAIGIATNTVGFQNQLVDQALYQIVRSGVEQHDLPGASRAVGHLIDWFPDRFYSDRAVLIYGQALNREGRPAESRTVLASFAKVFPKSTLLPEAQLAVARTHVMDGSWVSSLLEYDRWVTNYPVHPALPQAEFDRAWLNHQAGNPARAFQLFTNYVVRFPTHPLAPVAQKWIADRQFQSGKFTEAEHGYRRLFENTNLLANAPGMEWEARLSAGRSAFFRQEHAAAELLLASVVNATNAPIADQARAEFYLGDVAADQTARTPTNLLDALPHYQRVADEFTDSPLHSMAWGRVGDCHLQLTNLTKAAEAYRVVAGQWGTYVATRSQAALGLARVLDEQAKRTGDTAEREKLLQQSLKQCMDIIFGGNLLTADEKADPFWVKEAGLMAGRLAKRLGQAEQERKVYSRLTTELPNMPLWRVRLDALEAKPGASAKP
ncbi:MAG: tetratricopeptide repeat protein [Verrucomicrobiota bacterium]|nr:tetratricopeptide repeat protein [Verrucomicrobiota bacterium]